jgi:hypothetical protein
MQIASSVYHRFVGLEKRTKNVRIHFQKGASYLYLPGAKSDVLIERLNAILVASAVLRDIGISGLLKQNKRRFCHFKARDVLVKQGNIARRVLLLVKGSCFVFRSSNKRRAQVCVGSLASPSFVFSPQLLDSVNDDCFYPVWIVAVSDGYVLVCSRRFSFCNQAR